MKIWRINNENIKNQIPDNKFIVGYTGTIGVANALDSFLDAINKINNDSILGDG